MRFIVLFQELVQNAEDAKATEVKFLLDETQHEARPKYMHHAELSDYQVIIYVYFRGQNCLFTKDE